MPSTIFNTTLSLTGGKAHTTPTPARKARQASTALTKPKTPPGLGEKPREGASARQKPKAATTPSREFHPNPIVSQVIIPLFVQIVGGVISACIVFMLQRYVVHSQGFLDRTEIFVLSLAGMVIAVAFFFGVCWMAYSWRMKKSESARRSADQELPPALSTRQEPPEFPKTIIIVGSIIIVAVATAILVALGSGQFTPKVVHEWDFESPSGNEWGIYDEPSGRVIKSDQVAVKATAFAKDGHCLEVINNNHTAHSATEDPAIKRWPAVAYEAGLERTRLTALVYIPEDAQYLYADAEFFLFAGMGKEWKESSSGIFGEGVVLIPGKWVEVSWNLRPLKTAGWPEPWPWRHIFGIQLYVASEKGSKVYDGPIYIDNVTIYK